MENLHSSAGVDENLGNWDSDGQRDQWHLLQGHDTRDPQGKVVGTLLLCYPTHICPLHKLSWPERQGEMLLE